MRLELYSVMKIRHTRGIQSLVIAKVELTLIILFVVILGWLVGKKVKS